MELSNEYLITLGIFLYVASTVISVLEEWTKQGLTDTSYFCLGLWTIASLGMGVWAVRVQHQGVFIVAVISVALCLWAMWLKRRCWKR